jgi:hypothetical protein
LCGAGDAEVLGTWEFIRKNAREDERFLIRFDVKSSGFELEGSFSELIG